jgi:hypothetical protein
VASFLLSIKYIRHNWVQSSDLCNSQTNKRMVIMNKLAEKEYIKKKEET